MTRTDPLHDLLTRFKAGEVSADQVLKRLSSAMGLADLGHARLDTCRSARTGLPEAVYCASKTPQQVADIFVELAKGGKGVLGTRARAEHFAAVRQQLAGAQFDDASGLVLLPPAEPPVLVGMVVAVCAGTSDLPVLEEAAKTAEFLGSRVVRHADCGVAGLHRLATVLPDLADAHAAVVAAGMDGVLPTVVAGLCSCPVIGLPTSVGYGTGTGGAAALNTMLNSCAPGLAVVNIDNGFGAGCLAHRINLQTVGKHAS